MIENLRALIEANEAKLIQAYRKFTDPPPPNYRGDRDIEYSWIAGRCPEGPGRGLDFGCGRSYMALVAVRRGFKMLAIDLNCAMVVLSPESEVHAGGHIRLGAGS